MATELVPRPLRPLGRARGAAAVERTAGVGEHLLVELAPGDPSATLIWCPSKLLLESAPPRGPPGPQSMARLRVDKKLPQFLEGQQMNPAAAFCSICNGALLQLVVLRGGVSLHHFIAL